MVYIRSILGVALLASVARALPMPIPQDSAIGLEVGVSSPNGTPITDTVELASQTAAEAAAKTASVVVNEIPPAKPTQVQVYSQQPPQENPQQPPQENPQQPPQEHPQQPSQEHPPSKEPTPAKEKAYPAYGSGSTPWNNGQQYNDCVNQCMATHGKPPAGLAPTPASGHTESTPTAGAPSATHTVIVAPTQGVLRYVPFAVNASVGDTILFKWNANGHTVTKSSKLTPCNKTSEAFASGLQVKDFEFTQVVNTTEPTYFFCAAPTHCQKGMFGIINPPNKFGAPSTVAGQWSTLVKSDKDFATMSAWTNSKTADHPNAASWGRSIDMAQMPEWSHKMVMENVMYTRTFLAENPETMTEQGVSLSNGNSTPLKFPADISVALSNSGGSAPNYDQPSTSPQSATPQPEPANAQNAASAPLSNGAMPSMSPSITVGLITAVAIIFAL